jgi:broad specificity phosphatase PhoE
MRHGVDCIVASVQRAPLAASVVLVLLAATEHAASAQEAVYVVRHAERADQSSDPPLSAKGAERARRLAEMLKDARITHVFTTDLRRTIETASPLRGVVHTRSQQIPAADTQALVHQVTSLGPRDRALVVGHSNTVPAILRGLHVVESIMIADEEYDNLFIVVPQTHAAPILLRLKY